MSFNEFELLTLREGLFLARKNNLLDDLEFKKIDNKIKHLINCLEVEK